MASGLIIYKIGCFDCYLIMLGHTFQLFCQNASCKKISLEICLCKNVLLQISSPALLSGIIILKKTEIYTTYMLWSLHSSFNFASNMVFFNFMVFKCFFLNFLESWCKQTWIYKIWKDFYIIYIIKYDFWEEAFSKSFINSYMYIKCNPHHAPWNHDLNK